MWTCRTDKEQNSSLYFQFKLAYRTSEAICTSPYQMPSLADAHILSCCKVSYFCNLEKLLRSPSTNLNSNSFERWRWYLLNDCIEIQILLHFLNVWNLLFNVKKIVTLAYTVSSPDYWVTLIFEYFKMHRFWWNLLQ